MITVDHLLTHTAGGCGSPTDDPMFLNDQMDHAELINWTLNQIPLTNAPGTTYAYSNFGYCLLGRVAEKISGKRYEEYIGDGVLTPCDVMDMRIAGNTLAERAAKEVKYYCQIPRQDPYRLNVTRMDSHAGGSQRQRTSSEFFLISTALATPSC
jgi:CubicO group peptidase (beta-lactamase class C family)